MKEKFSSGKNIAWVISLKVSGKIDLEIHFSNKKNSIYIFGIIWSQKVSNNNIYHD